MIKNADLEARLNDLEARLSKHKTSITIILGNGLLCRDLATDEMEYIQPTDDDWDSLLLQYKDCIMPDIIPYEDDETINSSPEMQWVLKQMFPDYSIKKALRLLRKENVEYTAIHPSTSPMSHSAAPATVDKPIKLNSITTIERIEPVESVDARLKRIREQIAKDFDTESKVYIQF